MWQIIIAYFAEVTYQSQLIYIGCGIFRSRGENKMLDQADVIQMDRFSGQPDP